MFGLRSMRSMNKLLIGGYRSKSKLYKSCSSVDTAIPVQVMAKRASKRMFSALPKETAEEVVNNLLYNLPTDNSIADRHIITVFVDNEAGALSKISGLLASRGFNIDSLTVGATNVKGLSRMTIVLKGKMKQLLQCEKQLEDIVSVWAVFDYTDKEVVERELVLVKVSTRPRTETPSTILQPTEDQLRSQHYHRQAVMDLQKLFNAEVNDIGPEHVVLQLTSWQRRIDAFIKMLEPYGVLEIARSGVIAMVRSNVGEKEVEEYREAVDIADLPPS
jgi:acetolactate synthase-1/3 small subunit